MKNIDPKPESVCDRGLQIYADRLRSILEPQHLGEYVVIDVETGEYEVDKDQLAASDRAFAKRVGALLFATRVGSRTICRIGGSSFVAKHYIRQSESI